MYQSIGMPEFEQLIKKQAVKIIDVREMDEFASGHISDSVNLPLSTLQQTFSQLPKDTNYYLICHSGGRSNMACQFLAAQGFSVTNVLGGMAAWKGRVIYGM